MACLDEMLQLKPSSTSAVLTSEHISQPIRDRLASHVTTVTDMLRDCCEDLLSISVLYPAAPWVRTGHFTSADMKELMACKPPKDGGGWGGTWDTSHFISANMKELMACKPLKDG